MSERKQYTASIVGAGAVGEYHIKAQQKLGSKVLIYEPNRDRADLMRDKYNIEVVSRLEEAVLRSDVVHICTPHPLHAEGTLAAIEQRVPVIVEKPLTVKLEDSVAIYRAAKENGTPVLVGTSFRLTPAFFEMYKRIRSGYIGDLLKVDSTYLHNMDRGMTQAVTDKKWKLSPDRGSWLIGGGSHAVDLNMWIANEPIEEVQAMVGGQKFRNAYPGEEDFNLFLRYKNGLVGHVWTSAAAELPRHGANLNAFGTEGAYRAFTKDPVLESYEPGDDEWVEEDYPLFPTVDAMSEIFNAYIRGERPDFKPMPDIEEGLNVMIALHTLDIASKSGRTEKVPSLQEVVK